jgi:hypothetical protein
VYCCAPAIVWVKDAGQTILVEKNTERCWTIDGTEAMVWDLLTLNYTFERMVRFLSVALETRADAAQKVLLAILHGWEELGILQPTGGDGCG